jgi:hypothetical protein
MSMVSDLHDLWRQRQEVGAALNSGLVAADDPAWERFPDLDEAIREARPTDLAGLAIQMRLLADEFAARGHVADEKLALRIATVLEKLGQADQHRKPVSSGDFAQIASGKTAAPVQRPPRRLAWIDCAGPGARRPLAEQFVSQVAALVWTINIWVTVFRAWWTRYRAAPARRPAAAGAHNGNAKTTACGPSFPLPQALAVTADPVRRSRKLDQVPAQLNRSRLRSGMPGVSSSGWCVSSGLQLIDSTLDTCEHLIPAAND